MPLLLTRTIEPLEPRVLLCLQGLAGLAEVSLWAAPRGGATAAAAATAPGAPAAQGVLADSGMPLLHSLPGAAAAVYLDFDGYGTNAPYDTDGDPATFGPSEQADIREAWRHVASYFSMFNLDVTTEKPGLGSPFSYSLVTNSLASGFNLGYFPADEPTNFNASAHARDRQSALAHEIGHSFGLYHQSVFDRKGVKVSEYFEGYDRLHGPIMGVDSAGDVHKWHIGHPSPSPLLVQDDVAVIAAKVAAFSGGDGFRPDDVPGERSAALPLVLAADGSGVQRASGIIERVSDADAFSFTSSGGRVWLDLVPPAPSMLDAKLEVYDAGGALIAAADGPLNDQHLDFPALPAGTYVAVVKSHGDYADLGPYDLAVTETDADPGPPPQYNALPAPAGLTLSNGAGTEIDARWDPVEGAAEYLLERSDDGIVWGDAGRTDGPLPAFADVPPAGGHRYFYRVRALDDSGTSPPSAAAHLVNRPAAVADLSYTNWRTEAFVLNWRDTSGETGYRVERKLDMGGIGSVWTVLARLGPNVPSFTDRDAGLGMRYRYRVTPTGPAGDSPAAEIIAATPLVAVQGLRLTARAASSVGLAWDPIGGAVEYVVERSTDGINYDRLPATTSVTYTDSTVNPATKYYYRVEGANDLGERARSAPLVLATPSSRRLPAGWLAADVGAAANGAAGTVATNAFDYDPANDTWKVVGGGRGLVAGTPSMQPPDSFRFVYRRITGNTAITARIVTQSPPPSSSVPGRSMAGVMIREDGNDPIGAYVFAGVSSQGALGSQVRRQYGARAGSFAQGATVNFPAWVRLIRATNQVSIYFQYSGNNWQPWGTIPLSVSATALVGLVVTAGSDAELSEVTFDNVIVGNNRVPRIEQFPTVPAQMEGTSLDLSTLASDEAGEELLTYAWSVTGAPGPPLPTFSDNASNSAKNVTVTFRRAGRYSFRLTVTNPQRLSATWNFTVEVLPVLTRLAIAPRGVPVAAATTTPFAASLLDQFGATYVPPPSLPAPPVTWTAYHGTVNEAGLYTAPPYWAWDSVTATAGAVSDVLDVYVYEEVGGPVLLSAASRKVHGGRGPFDLPLTIYGAPPTVEPRRGGPTTIRFTFSSDVVAADGVLDENDFDVTNATFVSARAAGALLTLELSHPRDRSTVRVRLTNLADPEGYLLQGVNVVDISALYGDVDGSGLVEQKDLNAVRERLLRPTSAADFLRDIDLNGVITSADLLLVRRRFGGFLE